MIKKIIYITFFILTIAINAQEVSDLPPENFRKVIEDAKKKVFPALVFVKPVVENFDSGKLRHHVVFGSGVIISKDGYCVTNHHVVNKAKDIKCVLSDKVQVNAKLIGSDQDTDLALLKLEVNEDVSFATFGDSSKIQEGQFVMAMGSPFGFSRSISFGIISYTKRYLDYGPYNLWIQTDAAINPGNSGGPLINTNGEIIGINTLGTNGSIGFSIHSDKVKEVVEALKIHGEKGVPRTWTGITFQALKDFSTENILNIDNGVMVANVEKGSPADDAGLKPGDLILSCDGNPINGIYLEDLPIVRSFFANLKENSEVNLKIERESKMLEIKMKLIPKGKVEGDSFEAKEWNMTFREINRFSDPDLAFIQEKGIFVLGIKHQGNARFSGFNHHDIIQSIDGESITTLEQMKKIYEKSLEKKDISRKLFFTVLRYNKPYYLVLDYQTDYNKLEKEQ